MCGVINVNATPFSECDMMNRLCNRIREECLSELVYVSVIYVVSEDEEE
jgi:hypothetical protein